MFQPYSISLSLCLIISGLRVKKKAVHNQSVFTIHYVQSGRYPGPECLTFWDSDSR